MKYLECTRICSRSHHQIVTNTLHLGIPPSNMPPPQILVVSPPACHLHNASDHASLFYSTHAIYAVFPRRTTASCLLYVSVTFLLYLLPVFDICSCIYIFHRGLQVNIQQLLKILIQQLPFKYLKLQQSHHIK